MESRDIYLSDDHYVILHHYLWLRYYIQLNQYASFSNPAYLPGLIQYFYNGVVKTVGDTFLILFIFEILFSPGIGKVHRLHQESSQSSRIPSDDGKSPPSDESSSVF